MTEDKKEEVERNEEETVGAIAVENEIDSDGWEEEKDLGESVGDFEYFEDSVELPEGSNEEDEEEFDEKVEREEGSVNFKQEEKPAVYKPIPPSVHETETPVVPKVQAPSSPKSSDRAKNYRAVTLERDIGMSPRHTPTKQKMIRVVKEGKNRRRRLKGVR